MENFAVGEIVWAKIRGYPWWPAMVSKKQLSHIYFFKKYISSLSDYRNSRRQ